MSTKLKENQLAAIALLLTGMRAKEVAEKVDVAAETISRWRRDPNFISELNRLQVDIHDDARLYIRALLPEATKALAGILNNEAVSPGNKLAAATKIFDLCRMTVAGSRAVGSEDSTKIGELQQMEAIVPEAKLGHIINGRGLKWE